MGTAGQISHGEPWNKGKIVGPKAPFKLKDIWEGVHVRKDRWGGGGLRGV